MQHKTTLSPEEAAELARGGHSNPFGVLGPHRLPSGRWVIRSLVPGAETLRIVAPDGEAIAQAAPAGGGLFVTELDQHPGAYRLAAERGEARWELEDPYRFGPVIGELDEHLIAEGTHQRLWKVLGAHLRTHEGVAGVSFAVWAPGAKRV
ncbi:MAG: 1,4-alpha-glucan branching enzyme, partial [Pseudomonadota bacterium]